MGAKCPKAGPPGLGDTDQGNHQPVSGQRGPELAGQTVVVIGGSAGIGRETARRARAEGAEVILTGRNRDRLQQAAQDVGAQRTAAFDAGDAAVLARFFQDLPTPIDHVMVTAGRRVRRGLGIVSAATAALPPFTAALALELAPVRVNLIAPASSIPVVGGASRRPTGGAPRGTAGDAADRPRRRRRARRPHHDARLTPALIRPRGGCCG